MAHDRVVIIGGGIAGVSAAAALRSGGYPGEVVLIDDSAELPYDRPPLSKAYLVGDKDLAGIALQQPEWYAANHVRLVAPAAVESVEPGEDGVVVTTAAGVFEADDVILATGGRAFLPPIPGIDLDGVFVLREHHDADRLRAFLHEGSRILVVGGGLIGAEAAATAVKLGARVTLVDPVVPLEPVVGHEVAVWLHSLHAAHGVETVTGTVASLSDTPDGIEAVLGDETRVFDAVLVGVGMASETALAAAAGLDIDRGILTDEDQATSAPHVYAIGDCAQTRGQRRTEQWEAAQKDAERAAARILGLPRPAQGALWWWSDRYDLHVEGVGDMGEGDTVVRGTIGEPPFAVFALRDGHVVGAVAVDDSQAIRAARRLIDRRIPVDPAVLADPATDLRKLLKG